MHDKNATPIKTIDFEVLQKSDGQNNKVKLPLYRKPILWLAFISLLFCALIVFLYLPNYISEKNDSNIASKKDIKQLSVNAIQPKIIPEVNTTEAVATLSPEELITLKQDAEELLLQVIEKQTLLESKAVKKWAGEEFKAVLTLGSNADELFRKKEYQQAIVGYKDTIKVLDGLEKNITPTLKEHINKGELALTQAEQDTAIFHFELVKAIDAENIQARNGLKRTKTIKDLYALLDQGGKFEAANRFTDAKASYLEATELDPLSTEAKQALIRVSNRLTQNKFTKLINQGHTALKLHQYSDARAAFNAAKKLSPNSDKPKQGLASIAEAIRSEKLTALKAEAQYFENSQDWGNAVKSYRQILALSPSLHSAQQGLGRSQQHAEMLISLNEYINSPLRLSTEQVANEAEQLIQDIASITKPGSKIEQSVEELRTLLHLAKQPISIILQSDKLTDVDIFKVGRFGKFDQRIVELKTGKYTIVGSRAGFRDVRKVLTVTTDMADKTILISCDEPI